MRLYNSLSRQVERLRPPTGRPISLYVCGITPYDTTHLGHAFTYLVFDVLRRFLEVVHGWPVHYVQNVTDIDDDILRRAGELGVDWRHLGTEWTRRFVTDLTALQVRPPDRFPGATAHIPDIVDAVATLLRHGYAYERKGGVYFRVAQDPGFGALGGLDPAAMLATANERGNDPSDPNKEHPLDFVLWQARRTGEPAWHSPWGPGRPGWHIECTAMALALLGKAVDIHGGGADLIFPHHACEIAQSEAITGHRPFVRSWVHVAMVHEAGEKMSKSLGNLVLVRDLLTAHEPDTLRLYLLRHHYRAEWSWDESRLRESAGRTRTLHAAMARASGSGPPLDAGLYGPRFTAALDDDLNVPHAVETVLELADAILAAPPQADVATGQHVLSVLGSQVLGLWLKPWERARPQDLLPWPDTEVAPPDADPQTATPTALPG